MNIATNPGSGDFAARFALTKEQLLARRNAKWSQYAPDVIPAFVADMDFAIAPEIQAAIRTPVEAEDYGYPMRDGQKADRAVAAAFSRRMARLYDWQVDPDLTLVLADLVQATFAAVMAFSEPGNGVIVQEPNYPPFRAAVADCGRHFVPMPMAMTDEGYRFDLAELEARMTPDVRILILCNPQNPTGRVFSRAELEALLAFAETHDLVVISDEIHSDLIFDGRQHLPFGALGLRAMARCVTLNSATKSFNIPGLRTAVMSFGSADLKDRFECRFPSRVIGSVNTLGIDATVAAWDLGDDWLSGLLDHLQAMRDHMAARIRAEMPAIRFRAPESTYLCWLDCNDLGIEGSAFDFFHDEARIAFSPGENFRPDAAKMVRLNFATSKEILDEVLDRMVAALRRNAR
ncbi:aminotransferase class I/II-fold pyridoxal phosphate-dependent enzyme [Rhodobacter sp. NTK016B]|uniref:MalY/PatB family protein n=1 Tax=Rhodobacter sp. NTK016B TaxID=2759676 RepID=UPI001A8E5888|nr:aminotransferase class I/II-fold pyridoxal phosphate-dependent enzyme [Rhodobacter sp. NTK016B]MBN8294812.1 aminotransferase class I/II-fold pyridoxal phosphate-dependent enzyme [Rhodobacter sp. NTK016B]